MHLCTRPPADMPASTEPTLVTCLSVGGQQPTLMLCIAVLVTRWKHGALHHAGYICLCCAVNPDPTEVRPAQGWDVSTTVSRALECGAELEAEVRASLFPCASLMLGARAACALAWEAAAVLRLAAGALKTMLVCVLAELKTQSAA